MSTENTPVEPVETNLDDFAADFFGRKEAAPVETNTEVIEEEPTESDVPEDTHVDGDDTSAPDNDDDTSEEQETPVEEAPKPKKNRFQERIDQAVGKQREAERQLAEALAKLAEKENAKTEQPAPKVESSGPTPADTNEDGSEKYPLGEFDPGFIRDLMKHTLDEESKARKEMAKAEEETRRMQEAQAELQTVWNDKLVTARERYPDFQEKGEQMLGTFENIDPAYGEYLTNTIMDMEYGPDVFYYLSSNLDVAQQIIDSGPKKATIALGRLEAKFADSLEEKPQARPRISQAPPPPGHLNKGSAAAPPAIKGDEKDLDSFSNAFFKKKGRA